MLMNLIRGKIFEAAMVLSASLVLALVASAAPVQEHAGARIKLKGSYQKVQLEEGSAAVTFLSVAAHDTLVMDVPGPVRLMMVVRARVKNHIQLELGLDQQERSSVKIWAEPYFSSSFLVPVPSGMHELRITPDQDFMVRPVVVTRPAKFGETEVTWAMVKGQHQKEQIEKKKEWPSPGDPAELTRRISLSHEGRRGKKVTIKKGERLVVVEVGRNKLKVRHEGKAALGWVKRALLVPVAAEEPAEAAVPVVTAEPEKTTAPVAAEEPPAEATEPVATEEPEGFDEPGGARPLRLLMMGLAAGPGLPAALQRETNAAIAEQINGRPDMRRLSASELRILVGQDGMQCTDDASCLALAASAHADLLLRGSVQVDAAVAALELAVFEVASGRIRVRQEVAVTRVDYLPTAASSTARSVLAALGPVQPLPLCARVNASSYAVFDLQVTGLPEESSAPLTRALQAELERLGDTIVIGRDAMVRELELPDTRSLTTCTSDRCRHQIGTALGVDRLVVGRIDRQAEQYKLTLRLLVPQKLRDENQVVEEFRGDLSQLPGAVRQAGRRLLGVSAAESGQLVVTASESATIHLDEVERGRLPLGPLENIAAGRHHLRVSREGVDEWTSDVYIVPGETTMVWVELEHRPPAWYRNWWIWTAAGGLLAGGLAGAAITAMALSSP